MAEVARKKYPQKNVTILCGDVEETAFNRQFDCVVVYNAFPHFQNGERLIACLAAKLKPGGTLSIAHGMSREKIDAHHHGSAKVVSNGLISADELAEFFTRSGLAVTARISDDRMYQVTGKNKNQQRGK